MRSEHAGRGRVHQGESPWGTSSSRCPPKASVIFSLRGGASLEPADVWPGVSYASFATC